MIVALDSASPPNAAQVAQAKTAGIGMWNGYAASGGWGGSAFSLYRVWTKAEFDVVRGLNPAPIGYCSGWDDPVKLKALAAQWGIRLCLDVESGIRGDGSWVQPFLDASGAGLYGNQGVHTGRTAPFHIGSFYPYTAPQGTPTWPPGWVVPAGPKGWQWGNTHQEFGVGVDRCYFDDAFAALEEDMTPEQEAKLDHLVEIVDYLQADRAAVAGHTGQAYAQSLVNNYDGIQKLLQAAPGTLPQDVQDALKTIASHLR